MVVTDDANIVPNPTVGGSGGREFTDIEKFVKEIEIWHGDKAGAEQGHVLRGIRIKWQDNTRSPIRGRDEGTREHFELAKGERITGMSLWNAHSRTSRIEIVTDKKKSWVVGGTGGTQFIMDIGSGLLQGFKGRADWDLDKLTPRFYKLTDLPESHIVSAVEVGGTGGTPFWACRADSGHRVTKMEFWNGSANADPTIRWPPIIRAFRVTWDDETLTRWYGNPDAPGDQLDSFIFHHNETVKSMYVGVGERKHVGRIAVQTSQGRTFHVGSEKVEEPAVEVGHGVLVGFEGASSNAIDRLTPIFLA